MSESTVFRRRPNYAPDTLARPEHWGKHAACRPAPQDIFFPEDFSGAEAVAVAEQAKAYCRVCPAREACLAEALDRGEAFGVWGGTVAAERRAIGRRRREEARRAQAQAVATDAA
jgi:WhiB family redox-sensing transcriptional regulator